jgi:GNAT superfamily N-acetyltransferase
VVSDEHQRRGLGRRLRERLVTVACANGICSFEAFVTAHKFRIRRLLSGGGLTLVSTPSDLLEATLVDGNSAAE